ncbi:MAG: ribonuclease HI [Clostridiales Family XIII bacterium]|jgi:ribonuclease HI|nr:ribonuclease HI [Clostridiales Family XIII bacterium]
MTNIISIYADGACRGNHAEYTIGGFGAILEFNGNNKELKYAVRGTTNNRMEITAVLAGLNEIKNDSIKNENFAINIFSDSSYVINCMRKKWYEKWQKNNWKNSNKEPVKNKELWEELFERIEEIKKCKTEINFYHIKGHLDIKKELVLMENYKKFNKKNNLSFNEDEFFHVAEMNNRADKLANEAMDII